MVLKKKYQTQKDAIATYDYTDLAEGTGVIKFYCVRGELGAGGTYILSTNAFLAGGDITDGDIKLHGSSMDVDFDLAPFNMPKVISGTAYLNAHAYGTGDTIAITATISKVSPAVTLGTATGNAAAHDEGILFPITLTKTEFKKGEVLRVNLTTAGGTNAYVSMNPLDTNGGIDIYIPFDLDI